VRWLVGLLGPLFSRPGRRAGQLGIAGGVGDRAVEIVRDALAADGLLTRRDLGERLAAVGVDPTGQAPIHVIRRAALEGLLCVVPRSGGKERYALLDDWIGDHPPIRSVAPQEASAELARRYLAAFGPATATDLAAWSGLPIGAARAALDAIADELTEVATRAGPAWMLSGAAHPPSRPTPVRLVGGFDSFLLGYADRLLHVSPADARRVNAGGGMIRPAVVADGRVIGTWAYRRQAGHHAIDVDTFRGLTGEERDAIEGEVGDVGRFLGTDPALTVTGA
jgi:hypothetical protein